MESKNSAASGGVGATGLLGIAFVVLKLCGVIHWSWWWVLSPWWVSLAIAIVILGGYFAYAFIKDTIKERKKK